MPSSRAVREGQVLAGAVVSVCDDHVALDLGACREGAFHSRGAARRYRKGDVLLCQVDRIDGRSGAISLRDPLAGGGAAGCLKLRPSAQASGEAATTPRAAASERRCGGGSGAGAGTGAVGGGKPLAAVRARAGAGWDHAGGMPLADVKVGSIVSGRVTNVARGLAFIDFGAVRDGALNLAESEAGGQRQLVKGECVQRLLVASVDLQWARVELKFPPPGEQDVIARVEQDWGRCLALYVHGSTIFSNKEPDDVDLLAVVDDACKRPIRSDSVESQFKLGRYEVSLYTRSAWLQKLRQMDLTMLTCLSLPQRFVLREVDPELRSMSIDPATLHEFIVAYAEFTWVKAHFMLEHKLDVLKSSKNAYFVMRVLELGSQLLEHGRIVDFQAANPWWDTIRGVYEQLAVKPGDWDVVEAVLASDVQAQFSRFHCKMERCLAPLLPKTLPRPLIPEVVSCLAASPCACSAAAACPPLPPPRRVEGSREEVCGLCNLRLTSGGLATVTLVRCRHVFHHICVAKRLRSDRESAAPHAAQCWECQQPVQLALDKDCLMPYRGRIGQRPRFGGYPATGLLPQEMPADDTSARFLLNQLMR